MHGVFLHVSVSECVMLVCLESGAQLNMHGVFLHVSVSECVMLVCLLRCTAKHARSVPTC